MKLILSDKKLELNINDPSIEYIDLSQLNISNCTGCFSCWTRTPGKCVIRDDAVKVYPKIAKSNYVIYVTRVKYGSYDTIMKTMLERAIPVQQAFIRLLEGETHHVQRAVQPKKALIIGYGDISSEEKQVFEALIHRNSKNMSFDEVCIRFVKENELENIVNEEVRSWEE